MHRDLSAPSAPSDPDPLGDAATTDVDLPRPFDVAAAAAPHEAALTREELAPYESLFLLLAGLRGAPIGAMQALFFAPALGITSRVVCYAHVARLVRAGYLRRVELSSTRSIFCLLHRALFSFESVRARATDQARKVPALATAEHAWLRARLHAALVSDGFIVGRGPRELGAVRRFLIDEQRARVARATTGEERDGAVMVLENLRACARLMPPLSSWCERCSQQPPRVSRILRGPPSSTTAPRAACLGCGRQLVRAVPERAFACKSCARLAPEPGRCACGDALAELDAIGADVAWRHSADHGFDVRVLLIDEAHRSLAKQLAELPAWITGQPRVPLVLRTTDGDSVWDRAKHDWGKRGRRHQVMLRMLATARTKDQSLARIQSGVKVVDYREDIQLRYVLGGRR